ncbi:MAG: signal recognition particle protein [Verrucomicrobiota bacterium]|nr:signal recognition particle protein [Verrucomicrobiota bacterium]
MFGSFIEKLQGLFSGLKGKKLTEDNIGEAVRQVRLALLDADVNYSVTSEFIKRVKEKALGEALLKAVDPGQQFIKIVHDELVALMGTEEAPLDLNGKTSVVMLCGLQGSGKTTTCAKLAAYIGRTEKHKKVLMAACDLQRPAAVLQLHKLGKEIGVDVFSIEGETSPVKIARQALEKAKREEYDVLLVDTAGRLHLDEELMKELEELKKLLEPREVLFVANATTGQDAVKIAAEFDRRVQITGTVLTMLDSNARAGAALSIREVTKRPLKFEGVGEKIADFQLFYPRSMADRILGMGDVINLVKKAQEAFDEKESKELEKKLKKASFTYEDYLKQMGAVKKMGSLKSLLKMMPGFSGLEDLDYSDKEFGKLEAMILSMTPAERQEIVELEHSRRRRIAKGSGVDIEEVNRMVKGFKRVKQLFKNMPDMKGKKPGLSDLKELKKQFEGKQWR